LFLGLIVALITGLSVGFLAEFFDHTVRRPEDVQKNVGLPVLCSFPSLGDDEEAAESEAGSMAQFKQTATASSASMLARTKQLFAARRTPKDAG